MVNNFLGRIKTTGYIRIYTMIKGVTFIGMETYKKLHACMGHRRVFWFEILQHTTSRERSGVYPANTTIPELVFHPTPE